MKEKRVLLRNIETRKMVLLSTLKDFLRIQVPISFISIVYFLIDISFKKFIFVCAINFLSYCLIMEVSKNYRVYEFLKDVIYYIKRGTIHYEFRTEQYKERKITREKEN